MNQFLIELAKQLGPDQIKEFVGHVNNVINNYLVPSDDNDDDEVDNPHHVDYTKKPTLMKPDGGWLSKDELSSTNQQMMEAIAHEKFIDGFLFAIKLIILFK